jgi:2-polyprenyl-6-methoxyphenol hydroxylase-like FAD-dependent oxidoreductase
MTIQSYHSRRRFRVIVIGAGIGGLTAALAFRRAGAHVQVFERASVIREVGAGIGIWANAVRVLDALGVGPALRARSIPVRKVGIYTADGTPLTETNLTGLTHDLGSPSFVVHRADLQQALLDALPPEVITTGAECTEVTKTGRGVQVSFNDHAPAEADLVVGADGINSVIRHHLWGETPVRYSGQHCYRGVVDLPVEHPGLLAEIQDAGMRMGYCPFSEQRMYWWACVNAPRQAPEDKRGAKAALLERFANFPFGLPAAIAATEPSAILRNDLCDRVPLKRWSRGAITLLGDAAHPMLPNLGQGACTAIEDAAVLVECLAGGPDLRNGLVRYEAARIPRTTRMVELSWRFGVLARWSHPLAVGLRQTLLRLAPADAMRRELVAQLDYDTGITRRPEPSVLPVPVLEEQLS